MESKRSGKQYLIINEKKIRVKYGTINKSDPSVIFIRAKGDVRPYEKRNTYTDVVSGFKKKFTHIIRTNLQRSGLECGKKLFNVEISDNSLAYNKSGHIRYEIYVCPSEVKPLTEHEETMRSLAEGVNKDIKEYFEDNGIHAF